MWVWVFYWYLLGNGFNGVGGDWRGSMVMARVNLLVVLYSFLKVSIV